MENQGIRDGIAIVGLAGRFPGAADARQLFANVAAGVESITRFSDEEMLRAGADPAALKSASYIRTAPVLADADAFDAAFFGVSRREAELTDPQHRLFLECAWEALEDAGYADGQGDRSIGVFAGVSFNGYLLYHLAPHLRTAQFSEFLQYLVGNDKDYLATRVSYKLNLRGPSMVVQTACSSSLVATAQACQSLLNYQCNLALAGGVAVRIPGRRGYLYEEGGVLSRDGHCRAFAAKASGTIYGDGVGVVVLKRLEDAMAERDHIYAVIRGCGVNNDGNAKVGYSAPSVEGQVMAIAAAQAMADVGPDSITYVEAHGTGTPLGDPIEIAALTQAFRAGTAKTGFCAIGSVKTNIGHLDGAAGVASLIKTALALEHRKLLPSLYFDEPNPQIDFADSPFYVNTQLKPWPQGETPRRAGVSSFGFGGTNAHLILEEAPPTSQRSREKEHGPLPLCLLALSAKTPRALHALAERYLRWLRENPTASVVDICFTASGGRTHFKHRLAVTGRSVEALIGKLAGFIGVAAPTSAAEEVTEEARKIASLAALYESGGEVDWSALPGASSACRLPLPTYPFERERYLIEPPATSSVPERSEPPRPEAGLYELVWLPAAAAPEAASEQRQDELPWLLFADGGGVATQLQRTLRAQGARVILVRAGRSRFVRAATQWSIDPLNPGDFHWLKEQLDRNFPGAACRVVFLWGLDAVDEPAEAAKLLSGQDVLCGSLVHILQALSPQLHKLWVVTCGAVAVAGHPRPLALEQAPLWGLGKVIGQEYESAWGGLLDLDPELPIEASVESLALELRSAPAELVAYRVGQRLVARLKSHALAPKSPPPSFASTETYLITGGLGGLGLSLARWLVQGGARSLVLLGRHAPSIEQAAAVEQLRAAGCAVHIFAADVSRGEEVAGALQHIATRLPPLAGVFHLAGVLRVAPLPQLDWQQAQEVLAAKIAGSFNLHLFTQELPLRYFVMFSSISSSVGAPGTASYACANAFLDGLASHRVALGLPALSINWGAWLGAGMAERLHAATGPASELTGLSPLRADSALRCLGQLLQAESGQFTVAAADWSAWRRHLGVPQPLLQLLLSDPRQSAPQAPRFHELLGLPAAARKAHLLRLIQELVAKLLGVADPGSLDVQQGLTEMGLDSLRAVQLRNELQAASGAELSATLMFNHPNIAALTDHLLGKLSLAQPAFEPPILAPVVQVPVPGRSPREPIAIIGVGCRFPGEVFTPHDYWQLLRQGVDAITEIPATRFDAAGLYDPDPQAVGKSYLRHGGFIAGIEQFDAQFFGISPREAMHLDPQQRLLLEVCWEALERAGHSPKGLVGQRVGVFAGIGSADFGIREMATQGLAGIDLYSGSGTAVAFGPGRISYVLGLQGPSLAVDTACSSSLVAVHLACQSLRSGESSLALAGGVHVILAPETNVYLSRVEAVSKEGRCRTFDAAADGYGRGEGCGVVVLKRYADALADGDPILAVIRGSAVNHDGVSTGLTVPNGQAQEQVIRLALENAGTAPHEVSYVEAHGTGTLLGDPIEAEALAHAYRERSAEPLLIGSVKTNIGHLEAAAGIAGLIKLVLALQHRELPGSLHFVNPNPHIPWSALPLRVVTQRRPWEGSPGPRVAGVSAFGLSGTNAHVILAEPPPTAARLAAPRRGPHLFTLSARSSAALQQLVAKYIQALQASPELRIDDICRTSHVGRVHFEQRLAVCAESTPALLTSLQGFLAGEKRDDVYIGNRELGALPAELPQAPWPQRIRVLARLYSQGAAVDFAALDKECGGCRVALPTYAFERQRHWPDRAATRAPKASAETTNSETGTKALADFTMSYLRRIFAETLRLAPAELDGRKTYEAFGLDSMLGQEIVRRLEQDLGPLSKTLLYEKNRLVDLCVYLQEIHGTTLAALAARQRAPLAPPAPAQPHSLLQPSSGLNANLKLAAAEPIAVIGLSGRYPQAEDLEQFWDNLMAGRDCITDLPKNRWRAEDYPVAQAGGSRHHGRGGFLADVDKFDPLFFSISPAEAALLVDPQERLFLETAWATFEDAGYTRQRFAELAGNSVGVYVGVTYHYYPLYLAEEWVKGNRLPLTTQLYTLANRLSYFMNFCGPSMPVDTACSSSLSAIHLACEAIRRGECVMALAGGVNLSLHPAKYFTLGSAGFMSDAGRCASFGAGGDGYVPGEGVGAVLLKPLRLALRDGDRIYGHILGSAMNHGGKTSGFSVPNPTAQAAVVAAAIERAGVSPRSISYVEAHGTGTALGDPIEVRGLQSAFARSTQDRQFCAIASVKSNIGHLEAAAGISQLTKVLLQLKHKTLAPSLHVETLNPYIDFAQTPFYVQRQMDEWRVPAGQPRRAGISSFGAGGANAHLIVEEHAAASAEHPEPPAGPLVFALSAQTPESLRQYAERYLHYLQKAAPKQSASAQKAWLAEVCYSLQTGREPFSARLALTVQDVSELQSALERYCRQPEALVCAGLASHRVASVDSPQPIDSADPQVMARKWLAGETLIWESLYPAGLPRRIRLPTYPFARRRCWVPGQSSFSEQSLQAADNEPRPDATDWLHAERFEILPLPQSGEEVGVRLVFCDPDTRRALAGVPAFARALYCHGGATFRRADASTYFIDPQAPQDHARLWAALRNQGTLPASIVYFAFAEAPADRTILWLLFLQALLRGSWQAEPALALVSRGAEQVLPDEPVEIWQHPLRAFVSILTLEQPALRPVHVDLDPRQPLAAQAAMLHSVVGSSVREACIALRGERCYGLRLTRSAPRSEAPASPSSAWQPPVAALVTGGLGALGHEVAAWLIKKGTRKLLLVGTAALPPRAHWKHTDEPRLRERIERLLDLEAAGADVRYAAVDVADERAMAQALADAEAAWGEAVDGVFHLAGTTTGSIPVEQTDPALLTQVLRSKVQGTLVLHKLFPDARCRSFVLFSSTSAVPGFGVSGLLAYAAANAFLDGFARHRRAQGLPALSINWTTWAEKGMGREYRHDTIVGLLGLTALPTEVGLTALHALLAQGASDAVVMKVDWRRFFQVNGSLRHWPYFAHVAPELPQREGKRSRHDRAAILRILTQGLAKLVCMQPAELDLDAPFAGYGVDSILGIKFITELAEVFAEQISPMDLYRHTTLNQLAAALAARQEPEQTPPAQVVDADGDLAAEIQAAETLLAQVGRLS